MVTPKSERVSRSLDALTKRTIRSSKCHSGSHTTFQNHSHPYDYNTQSINEHNFFSNIFLFINSGAGSRLLRPVVMFAQGKVDAVNEALYPSL